MKHLSTNEIRNLYLDFFKEKDHLVVDSFPLVPKDDKSLLLINAGMAPLKSYFTGVKTPPNTRMATCQKCIRTGDIENVGRTKRHATFFEMLGNFSFGDYFKAEIIPWAWIFVTEVLEINKDKLYATIYHEDDEAFDIWATQTDIDPARIFRLGKEDNFWEIGVGPCGPSSEIHYYRGTAPIESVEDFLAASDRDEMTEFWNLVFTQFDKDEEGVYHPLKSPNIDTGMGLERMATIMQGVSSIFDIDVIRHIRTKVEAVTGVSYGEEEEKDVSIRIIADHAKSLAFLIGDGVLPSNEGRGYVLRRLLRRAARHGRVLGHSAMFLNQVIDGVIESYREAYPELEEKKDFIHKIVEMEERKFAETIDAGMELLLGYVEELEEETFHGAHAFKLYDTYGFPLELTEEILAERGLRLDRQGFQVEMEKQRERARSARGESSYMGSERRGVDLIESRHMTEFLGYSALEARGQILALADEQGEASRILEGKRGYVVSDRTPFYPEMGGQVGDVGTILGDTYRARVLDTKKSKNGNTVHVVQVEEGDLQQGMAAFIVSSDIRSSVERNHTATHLLHKALKMVLGSHVNQAGSIVLPDRLRFDFNHFQGVSKEELQRIEVLVNEEILKATPVTTEIMSIAEARKNGAMALFDEKYEDEVRVLSVGDFSKELCGGTHVRNTGEIGLFKITSESGIASGVRRIEALTGMNAYRHQESKEALLAELGEILKTGEKELPARAKSLLQELKALHKEMEEWKKSQSLAGLDALLARKENVQGIALVKGQVEGADPATLRELAEKVLDHLGSGVVVLGARAEDKVSFSVMISKDLVKKGLHAGKIIKEVAKVAGGGGGGRPDMAQAGGKDPEKLAEALELVNSLITG